MPEALNGQQLDEISISAALSQYVYSNEQRDAYEGETISEIIRLSQREGGMLSQDSTLRATADNPDVANMRLICQSSIGTSDSNTFDMKKVIACAFADEDGNVYISFRGTGDGKWLDNGDALTKESSEMQREALKFFERAVEKADSEGYSGKIIVTGHSKGGNSAQFVTMASKYAGRVDACYSFDGQGFSNAAIESFKKNLGDGYEAQCEKLYSINGRNDYVHDLGFPIIDSEHTYFLDTNEVGFEAFHLLPNMFTDGKLNWSLTDNKEIDWAKAGEQGSLGKLSKEISTELMKLPPAQLDDCAVSVMSLLELIMDDKDHGTAYKEGTGDLRKVALPEEILTCINIGIPMITSVLRSSPNTSNVMQLFGLDMKWYVDPLLDIICNISENMTEEEFDGYRALISELSECAKQRGMDMNGLLEYIAEDPIRMIGIYSDLDVGKKSLHVALEKLFSSENLAKILAAAAVNHPVITGSLLALTMPNFSLTSGFAASVVGKIATFVVVAVTIRLIANHIIKNWEVIRDTIINAVNAAVNYIKDKITEYFLALRNAVRTIVNVEVAFVFDLAEDIVAIKKSLINAASEVAVGVLRETKKVAMQVVQSWLLVNNVIFYSIASKLFGYVREQIIINMTELRQCVDSMQRLAARVSNIDSRLDNLYYKLARNNIEQGENIFTSILNLYNLIKSDFVVDEGAAIKSRANALERLMDGYVKSEKLIRQKVPKKI